MGRYVDPPEKWLKDDEKMLTKVADYLGRKDALPFPTAGESRYDHILRAVQLVFFSEDGRQRYDLLRRAWYKHKSDQKKNRYSFSLRMPRYTRTMLRSLAGGAPLNQTLEGLISDAYAFKRDLEKDLKTKYKTKAEKAAPTASPVLKAELRRTKAGLERQTQLNQRLYGEISQYLVLLEDAGVSARQPLTAEQKVRAQEKLAAMEAQPDDRISEVLADEPTPEGTSGEPHTPEADQQPASNPRAHPEQQTPHEPPSELTPEKFEGALKKSTIRDHKGLDDPDGDG